VWDQGLRLWRSHVAAQQPASCAQSTRQLKLEPLGVPANILDRFVRHLRLMTEANQHLTAEDRS
jgi:hypothetical protein